MLPIYKEHNLSSIHNPLDISAAIALVVTNIQRTQFKFNSQPSVKDEEEPKGCYQYTKNTI